jgi:outer membrane lipoprotein-sorting protein
MRTVTSIFLILVSAALVEGQAIRNGEDLLRAMHARYQASWYHTLTFTQKSTTYKPDGTSSAETWYEALLLPGKLRIDVAPLSDGNGYVMADGTVSIVKNNQVANTRPLVNMLLVLGFDVYGQDPEKTIKVVKDEGYDLSKLHDDTWEGHAVYVVGAAKDDLKSRQFWIAKDTLLFLREFEPSRQDASKVEDIRFEDYNPLAGGWIAERVEVHSEGKLVFSEDYTDVRGNVKLPPEAFDAKQFAATHWEAK